MVDISRLRSIIKEKGMTVSATARMAGVERVTLYNRFAGKGEFTVSEIEGLSDALCLSTADRNEIFFCDKG